MEKIKNNKIAIVLAASTSQIHSDYREAAIFSQVSKWGYEAQIFRITEEGSAPQDLCFQYGDSIIRANFYKADDYLVCDHHRISSDLHDALIDFNPSVIFVKGFGYRLIDGIVDGFKETSFIVGIVGGLINKSSRYCDHVFLEDEYQIPLLLDNSGLGVTYSILPKYIDWGLIDEIKAVQGGIKKYDIICVGSVDDKKRQNIVLEHFSDLNICIAGFGPMYEELREKYIGFGNIEFTGFISKAEVYEKIINSKLLVHVSSFEGLPRVYAEATSLGTPVVGLTSTTPLLISKFRGVELCELSSLNQTVRQLLIDNDRYKTLSKFGIFHSSSFYSFDSILTNLRSVLSRFNPL